MGAREQALFRRAQSERPEMRFDAVDIVRSGALPNYLEEFAYPYLKAYRDGMIEHHDAFVGESPIRVEGMPAEGRIPDEICRQGRKRQSGAPEHQRNDPVNRATFVLVAVRTPFVVSVPRR